MDSSAEAFQISLEAAEVYESKFVPALFGEWAPHLIDAAGLAPGHAVLDVACGTGVVARAAADRIRGKGKVVGLDLNESMLAVARRVRPDIEWRQGDAAGLPFPDRSFDVILCQSALMFFPDPAQALREMRRVVTARGTVAVQVWGRLESQPGYGPFFEAIARHVGPEAMNLIGTYWIHGDLDKLAALFESAGLQVTGTRTRLGTARFDSIDTVVMTEVESTPLRARITDKVYREILDDSRGVLRQFQTHDGGVAIPIQGHIIIALRRA